MTLFIAKLLNSLKYLKVRDIIAPFIYVLILPIALVFRILHRAANKSLWLVAEGENDARDNGYAFFSYIRTNHPDMPVYYAINKKSSSYAKVSTYGNVIQYSGLKHWLFYLVATKNISIHKSANPNSPLFYVLHRLGLFDGNRIFLQHGVTMNNVQYLHYNETHFKLFICGAAPEYEYVQSNFGYPSENVVYLGFPRFDKLIELQGNTNKGQIVIMPTWRSWLGRDTNKLAKKLDILESDYYKTYQSLLNNKRFTDYIVRNKLNVYFLQHANMEKYASHFSVPVPNIKIVTSQDSDIQTLIVESEFMITDYSSVSVDFAYTGKPMAYYQFDEEAFRQGHLSEGYFSYREMGFGPVFTEEDSLVDNFIVQHRQGFVLDDKYSLRSSTFFKLRDEKNSLRIFEKLVEMDRTA